MLSLPRTDKVGHESWKQIAGWLTISWRKYQAYVKCIIHKNGTFMWFLYIQGRYKHETVDQSYMSDRDALNWTVRMHMTALGLANCWPIPGLKVSSRYLLEYRTLGETKCYSADFVQLFRFNKEYASVWLDFCSKYTWIISSLRDTKVRNTF